MSVYSSTIKCDKCDYGSSMSVVHGIFNYITDGNKYNVERSHGWCYECHKFVAVEDFNANKFIEAEIIEIQEKIKFVETAGFFTRMKSEYKQLKRNYEYYFKHIKELEWRINFNNNRKSLPKCLVCGATNIENINVKELDYYNPGPEKRIMGFKHPECGGNLWLVKSSYRFNIRYEPQLYNVEGNRIYNISDKT